MDKISSNTRYMTGMILCALGLMVAVMGSDAAYFGAVVLMALGTNELLIANTGRSL